MEEKEIKIAERFNILDKCQKLEKDFLRLSRITKVEFDLNGLYDNIYQVIILVKYEIPMELGPKKYFRIRTNILKKVLEIAQNNQLIRTDDSIEDYARWKSKFPKSIENSKDLKENQKQKLKKKIEELQSEYERLH